MQTIRKAMPQWGMIKIASHFNGWYMKGAKKRAFRYAIKRDGISRTYGTLSYNQYLNYLPLKWQATIV